LNWIIFPDCNKCNGTNKVVILPDNMTPQKTILEDNAFEYVMENMYDEVREAVFEQEAESQRE